MRHDVRVIPLAMPLLAAIAAASLACHDARIVHGQRVVCCAVASHEELDCHGSSDSINETSDDLCTCCQLGDPWKLSDSWRCSVVVGGWTQVPTPYV